MSDKQYCAKCTKSFGLFDEKYYIWQQDERVCICANCKDYLEKLSKTDDSKASTVVRGSDVIAKILLSFVTIIVIITFITANSTGVSPKTIDSPVYDPLSEKVSITRAGIPVIYGSPSLYVEIENKSDKTVEALRIKCRLLDGFGDNVAYGKNGMFSGIGQRKNILPGKKDNIEWPLVAEFYKAVKIDYCILDRIRFSDGTETKNLQEARFGND